jgi:ornithine cyclodeaminase
MPGALLDEGLLGTKVISIFPGNHRVGLPSHQGLILLFSALDGSPVAVLDAARITAMRTAAASAVATGALARADAGCLAILGAGALAGFHIEALARVRNLRKVRVWDIDPGRAAALVDREAPRWAFPVESSGTAEEAVRDADLICTLTPSREPVVSDAWVMPGAHLNAVGACAPHARELDSDLVARARLFTDSSESLAHEGGDYLIPKGEGRFGASHLQGELGSVLGGRVPGRRSEDEVTVFKALGLAVEDLAVGCWVYRKLNPGG